MICNKCNNQIMDDSKYCPLCGANQKKLSSKNGHEKMISDILLNKVSEVAKELVGEIISEEIVGVRKNAKKKGKKIVHKTLVKTGVVKENMGDKLEKILKNKKGMKK